MTVGRCWRASIFTILEKGPCKSAVKSSYITVSFLSPQILTQKFCIMLQMDGGVAGTTLLVTSWQGCGSYCTELLAEELCSATGRFVSDHFLLVEAALQQCPEGRRVIV